MQDAKSRQKSPSHHRTNLSGNIFATKARIDNRKFVKQQYVLHMSPQYGELQPTNGWDPSRSLRHPCKFHSRLGSVTARHLVAGVSQTLWRWTEDATCVRQATITLGIGPHSSHYKILLNYCNKVIIEVGTQNDKIIVKCSTLWDILYFAVNSLASDVCISLFMVALWNRADHYIFARWFLLSFFFFFRRLISAVADWMSAILPRLVWP